MAKMKKFFQENKKILGTNLFMALIKEFQAQVKTIRASTKWSILFLKQNLAFFYFLNVVASFLDQDPESVFPTRIRIQGSEFQRNTAYN